MPEPAREPLPSAKYPLRRRIQRKSAPTLHADLDVVELAVQRSLAMTTTLLREGKFTSEGTVFVRGFLDAIRENQDRVTDEFCLFENPVALYDFEIRNRRYICVDRNSQLRARRDETANADDAPELDSPEVHDVRSNEDEQIGSTVERLAKSLRRRVRKLDELATPEQALCELVGHLEDQRQRQETGGSEPRRPHEVHPRRRAALLEWLARHEDRYRSQFGHPEQGGGSFAYPVVETVLFGRANLAMMLVSPLDENFVDENVPSDHRIGRFTLALFDVRQQVSVGDHRELCPRLRQAFARMLYTNRTNASSEALTSAFGEFGAISRFWFRKASDGLDYLVDGRSSRNTFDAFEIGQAIVRKILCAEIDGVHDEVYPFNRAYIFSEAGVRGISTEEESEDAPIKMQVMQASILSKRPADRGQFLTSLERKIRGTEDYQCDASKKTIKQGNTTQFYIHGHDRGLLLSRRSCLSADEMDWSFENSGHIKNESLADKAGYVIGPPRRKSGQISDALYNLLGRINRKVIKDEKRPLPRPDGEDQERVQIAGFHDDFAKTRQVTLDRFDSSGLFFHYAHGLDLEKDIPLLAQIQTAFLQYIEDKNQSQELRYIEDSTREIGLGEEDLQRYQANHLRVCEQRRQKGEERFSPNRGESRQPRGKVVYISFSPRLHDENRTLLAKSSDDSRSLLGPEYTYTIVLVADEDRDKSQAQLQHEQQNLQLYFRMLMRQIWMDKRREYEYLEKKSGTVGSVLTSYFHNVKHKLAPEDRKEVDDRIKGFKTFIDPGSLAVRALEVRNATEVLASAVSQLSGKREWMQLEALLKTNVENWARKEREGGQEPNGKYEKVEFNLVPSSIPAMKIQWSDTIAREALEIALKNAAEAAAKDSGDSPFVSLGIQHAPRADGHSGHSFVDIVIENSGGPIPQDRLDQLNARNPNQDVDRNLEKSSSTGVGVFLSRFQLRETIGDGADLLLQNVGGDRVQCRLRFPAIVEHNTEVETDFVKELQLKDTDRPYVLYVEDNEKFYDVYRPQLNERVAQAEVDLIHAKDRDTALAKIKGGQLPLAIFSDLEIPASPKRGDADARHGRALLVKVMEAADSQGKDVPIWLLTGTSPEDVASLFERGGQPLPGGYQLQIPGFLKDCSTLERPSRILSMVLGDGAETSAKDPNGVPGLDSLLERAHPDSEDGTGTVDCRAATNLEVRNITLDELEAADPDELWKRLGGGESFPWVFVEAEADDEASVRAVCKRWEVYPGLRDLDPSFKDIDERTSLADHSVHIRVALIVRCPEDLLARVHHHWMYHCLVSNIWLVNDQLSKSEIHRRVTNLRRNHIGPVSKLRHDVINTMLGKTAEIQAEIKQLENTLRYPDWGLGVLPTAQVKLTVSRRASKAKGAEIHNAIQRLATHWSQARIDHTEHARTVQEQQLLSLSVLGSHLAER